MTTDPNAFMKPFTDMISAASKTSPLAKWSLLLTMKTAKTKAIC